MKNTRTPPKKKENIVKPPMTIGDWRKLLESAPDDTDISELLPKKEVVRVVSSDSATEIPIPTGRYPVVKHSVNLGDLVAAMGCIKKYYEITRRKCIVAQTINQAAMYYPGATHPTVDESGNQVCVNNKMFDMIAPLITSQEYVHAFERYSGQPVNIDFDVIRSKTFVNMPHGPIQGWIPIAWPDLLFDISKPWIHIDDNCPAHIKGQVVGKVIINFTDRYREPTMDYYFLKNYAPDIIFAGTEQEHWHFCNRWELTVPRLEINNFLELAYALKAARFCLGNQSLLWNLAQAMGTPRILEMCKFADNCFPGIGENSFGFFYQTGAEYYWRKLYNMTAAK